MTTPVGKTVLTAKGLLTLTDAARLGKKIAPKYFKVSSRDYDLYPGIDLQDLQDVWHQGNISGAFPIDNNTTEFLIDIPPEKAQNFGRTFGLYLEDGTLFLVGKPPYPFAPLMRQTFKMQLVWLNASEIIDFRYIPFYETEQDLSLLDSVSSVALSLFNIQEHLILIESLAKQTAKDFNGLKKEILGTLSTKISQNQSDISELLNAFLDFASTYGEQILKNSLQIGLLKGGN